MLEKYGSHLNVLTVAKALSSSENFANRAIFLEEIDFSDVTNENLGDILQHLAKMILNLDEYSDCDILITELIGIFDEQDAIAAV